MKYMMLIYLDEKALSEEQREKCYADSAQYAQTLAETGQYLGAGPLHPTATAMESEIAGARWRQSSRSPSNRNPG